MVGAETQATKQKQIPLEGVRHGMYIPGWLIEKYIPRNGQVVDLGGGDGRRARELLPLGYSVAVMDVHPEAVRIARGELPLVLETDVTRITLHDIFVLATFLENKDGVYAQGLLCNLLEWPKALMLASLCLKPGGHLLIADMAQVNHKHQAVFEHFMEKGDEVEAYEAWLERWENRYGANVDSGVPYGQIAVATPGHVESHWQWGDKLALNNLRNSSAYEREVVHIDPDELKVHLDALGFAVAHYEEAVWFSRDGSPLSGIVLVARKASEVYQYHPWYQGLTIEQAMQGRFDRSPFDQGYMEEYLEKLKENCPWIEELFPMFGEIAQGHTLWQ